MTKRSTAVLLAFALLLSIMLLAGIAAAEEKDKDILGKPFPDFTVTDTEGNTFTLSEALKNHEAVLINLWATWCYPCKREFPFLNEICKKYGDRLAMIALSMEEKDTIEKIAEYRKENGVLFPMGRDEGQELYRTIYADGVPATLIVDRFGNAVFYHDRTFRSAEDLERVLEKFLGDGYTQSAVLESIPRDASTKAFPVSAARALYPEDRNYQKILFHAEKLKKPVSCWIVPDESVLMRVEVDADDDVPAMQYWDSYSEENVYVEELLDSEAGIYINEQMMPLPEDHLPFVQIALLKDSDEEVDPNEIHFLIKDESGIEKVADSLKADGSGEVTWEYADADTQAENALKAYIIHVVDQDNNPVEEVTVNFCTDQACTPKETDETGTITFDGEPYKYHVQIIEVPEGYSWDESFDMYTAPVYGVWTLRIRKD